MKAIHVSAFCVTQCHPEGSCNRFSRLRCETTWRAITPVPTPSINAKWIWSYLSFTIKVSANKWQYFSKMLLFTPPYNTSWMLSGAYIKCSPKSLIFHSTISNPTAFCWNNKCNSQEYFSLHKSFNTSLHSLKTLISDQTQIQWKWKPTIQFQWLHHCRVLYKEYRVFHLKCVILN